MIEFHQSTQAFFISRFLIASIKFHYSLNPTCIPKVVISANVIRIVCIRLTTKLTIVFISVLRDSPANQIMSEMFDDHFTSDLPKICFVGV